MQRRADLDRRQRRRGMAASRRGRHLDDSDAEPLRDLLESGQATRLRASGDRWGGYAATTVLAIDYLQAMRVRGPIKRELDALYAKFDAIIAPSRPTVAYPIGVDFAKAPQARFSSVEQSPFRDLPIYFGFDAFAGAMHRDDPLINTPGLVARTEFAPRVTVPLRFGPWLNITTTATYRGTYYGESLVPGTIASDSTLSVLKIRVQLAPRFVVL